MSNAVLLSLIIVLVHEILIDNLMIT